VPVVTEPLPAFPYHPDPLGTGSVVESDARCLACDQARGYIYTGPVHARQPELDGALCPWCIADGTAATRFDAHFVDVGWGVPDAVPRSVTEAIAARTPGFIAWQGERWLYHCGDGAAFLGLVGRRELEAYPDALEMLRQEAIENGFSQDDVAEHLAGLRKDGDATAYLFQCRHCGSHLAYSDFA
jgi:uncharacterized protein CbrC (UPF0167 family)